MPLEIGLYLKFGCYCQSDEGFSQSITSDCLARLEDHGEADFNEQIIRELSGSMFAGKRSSRSSAGGCTADEY